MSEVAKLVGKEVREYTKDGQPKTFVGLHLVHVEGTVRDVEGCKVESLSCPRDVDYRLLKVGTTYELVYSFFDTAHGKMARLADLQEVDE